MAAEDIIELEINNASKGPSGAKHKAMLVATGEVLVDGVKDPEFAAARILQARGITGTLHTRWARSTHAI